MLYTINVLLMCRKPDKDPLTNLMPVSKAKAQHLSAEKKTMTCGKNSEAGWKFERETAIFFPPFVCRLFVVGGGDDMEERIIELLIVGSTMWAEVGFSCFFCNLQQLWQ